MTFLGDAKYVLRVGPDQTVEVDVTRDSVQQILDAHKVNNLFNIERALAKLAKKIIT